MIAPASRHVGKYEIRQKLARGGMADVYLAQDTAAVQAQRRGAELPAHPQAVDPRKVEKAMIAPASRHVGKYEIRQKLARGGMADVYLAQDTAAIQAQRRGAELPAHLQAVDPRKVKKP